MGQLDTVASWLVCLPLYLSLWAQALARDIVLSSSPGWGLGHNVEFLGAGRQYALLPLSIQLYKWVLVNLMLGITLG